VSIRTTQVVSSSVKVSFLIVAICLFTGCGVKQNNFVSTKTPVELMAMQVKGFEASKEVTFAAIVATFQNEGYKVVTASLESGFITAEGPTIEKFIAFVGNSMNTLKANAFVEKMGKEVKVRLSFVNEQVTSNGYGMEGGNDVPVEEPEFYQDIYSKLSKAIYLRKNLE
jgi:hypothetical protein